MPQNSSGVGSNATARPKKRHNRFVRFLRGLFAAPVAPPEAVASALGHSAGGGCGCCGCSGGSSAAGLPTPVCCCDAHGVCHREARTRKQQQQQPPPACQHPRCLMHRRGAICCWLARVPPLLDCSERLATNTGDDDAPATMQRTPSPEATPQRTSPKTTPPPTPPPRPLQWKLRRNNAFSALRQRSSAFSVSAEKSTTQNTTPDRGSTSGDFLLQLLTTQRSFASTGGMTTSGVAAAATVVPLVRTEKPSKTLSIGSQCKQDAQQRSQQVCSQSATSQAMESLTPRQQVLPTPHPLQLKPLHVQRPSATLAQPPMYLSTTTTSSEHVPSLISQPVRNSASARLQRAPISLRQLVTLREPAATNAESDANAADVAAPQIAASRKTTKTRTLHMAIVPKTQWLLQESAASLPPQPSTRTAAAEVAEQASSEHNCCRLQQLHRQPSVGLSSASQRPMLLTALTSQPPQPQLARLRSLPAVARPSQRSLTLSPIDRSQRCISVVVNEAASVSNVFSEVVKEPTSSTSTGSSQSSAADSTADRNSQPKHLPTTKTTPKSLFVGRVAETVRRFNAIPTATSARQVSALASTSLIPELVRQQRQLRQQGLLRAAPFAYHRATAAAPTAAAAATVTAAEINPQSIETAVTTAPNAVSSTNIGGTWPAAATADASSDDKPRVCFPELLARFEAIDRRRRERAAAANAVASEAAARAAAASEAAESTTATPTMAELGLAATEAATVLVPNSGKNNNDDGCKVDAASSVSAGKERNLLLSPVAAVPGHSAVRGAATSILNTSCLICSLTLLSLILTLLSQAVYAHFQFGRKA